MRNIQGTQSSSGTFSRWGKQIVDRLTTLAIVSFKEATRARSEYAGTEMKAFGETVAFSEPGPQWKAKAQELVRLGKQVVIMYAILSLKYNPACIFATKIIETARRV